MTTCSLSHAVADKLGIAELSGLQLPNAPDGLAIYLEQDSARCFFLAAKYQIDIEWFGKHVKAIKGEVCCEEVITNGDGEAAACRAILRCLLEI